MTSPQVQDDLDARYGRRPAGRRRIGVIVTAIALGVIAAVWLAWAQPWSTHAFWTSAGYGMVDDRTIVVKWSVTLGEGETASCALSAENVVHAIVGWKTVDVVGTELPTQQLSELLRTTEPADAGLVYRCWLT